MTPKEKAEDLLETAFMFSDETGPYDSRKEIALMVCDNLLEVLQGMKLIFSDRELVLKYWIDVKQEINNL